MSEIFAFRVSRKAAQKILDASEFESTLRPRPLPKVGYEKLVKEVRSNIPDFPHSVYVANVHGRLVLRCATLDSSKWLPLAGAQPSDLKRPCSWYGVEALEL